LPIEPVELVIGGEKLDASALMEIGCPAGRAGTAVAKRPGGRVKIVSQPRIPEIGRGFELGRYCQVFSVGHRLFANDEGTHLRWSCVLFVEEIGSEPLLPRREVPNLEMAIFSATSQA